MTWTPYTYLIGWRDLDRWYYGVRYARGCHPDDLWTNYYTSSSLVNGYRKTYGEPNVIEVRRTFLSQADAREWGYKVLRRINAIHNEKWLNRSTIKEFYIVEYD